MQFQLCTQAPKHRGIDVIGSLSGSGAFAASGEGRTSTPPRRTTNSDAEQARWAATTASSYVDLSGSGWALPELVEAAIRGGQADVVRGALERLAPRRRLPALTGGSGIEERSRGY
jgi:hypothetical protein